MYSVLERTAEEELPHTLIGRRIHLELRISGAPDAFAPRDNLIAIVLRRTPDERLTVHKVQNDDEEDGNATSSQLVKHLFYDIIYVASE